MNTTIEAAIASLRTIEEELLEYHNVTKTSVVPVLDEKGEATGEFFIEVGVRDRNLENQLISEGNSPLGKIRTIPLLTDGGENSNEFIPIRIIETGDISALPITTPAETADEAAMLYTGKFRPALGGDSIGNHRYNNAGTLGALVQGNDGSHYILTNWHVLVNNGTQQGDIILQPARLDGGSSPGDRIATLTAWRLDSFVDLALARIGSTSDVGPGTRCGFGFNISPSPPRVGMSVKKCGRTTNLSQGTILSTSASVNVSGYPGGTRTFRDQIEMSYMLNPGDSGSILCSGKDAVGLCFAGGTARSYANKLSYIFGPNLSSDDYDGFFISKGSLPILTGFTA